MQIKSQAKQEGDTHVSLRYKGQLSIRLKEKLQKRRISQ